MAYTRTYTTTVPVEPGTDEATLLWLTRESFERKAEGDCLHIVEFHSSVVDPADIPPKVAEQLGRPLTDFQWWQFGAVASA